MVRAAGLEPALFAISRRCLLPIGLRTLQRRRPTPRSGIADAKKVADGARFERAHPCGFADLASRCLTSRPTIRMCEGKPIPSRARDLAPRPEGPGSNATRRKRRPCGAPFAREQPKMVCASMIVLGSSRAATRASYNGAPGRSRTDNLRDLSAAPLPVGLQGLVQMFDFGDGRGAQMRVALSVNNASAYSVGRM